MAYKRGRNDSRQVYKNTLKNNGNDKGQYFFSYGFFIQSCLF